MKRAEATEVLSPESQTIGGGRLKGPLEVAEE